MEVSIKTILENQFLLDEFARLDIFVRVMVVEDLIGNGDGSGGFIYQQMYKGLFPRRKYRDINKRLLSFIDLVKNKEEFDLDSNPIHLTKAGKIWDGSHRLSIAIANKNETINAVEVRKNFRKQMDFTERTFKHLFDESDYEWLLSVKDYYFKYYEVKK